MRRPATGPEVPARRAQDAWMHLPRLRFAGALEDEFRNYFLQRTRGRARLWQTLELFVAPALLYFHFRMQAQSGGALHAPMLSMAALALATSVAMLLFVAFRYDSRHYLRVAAWLVPIRSVAYSVMIAYFVGATGSGTALLTASTFGHFFFSGLLFHQAAAAAGATLAAYLAALMMHEVSPGTIGYAIVVVMAMQTMAMVVAFDSQLAMRALFVEHGVAQSRAQRDGLTGLQNRQDFDERLDLLWQSATAAREPLTILMLDVDYFKAFNDRYGHQAGDDVLRRAAEAMRLAARAGDVVARYGGEEFVMLAQGLDEPGAAALAERIRVAVEQLALPHAGSSCATVVTVSVGVACAVPQDGRTPAGLVQLADQNLYLAKREGRNRCVSRGADYASLRTGRFDLPH